MAGSADPSENPVAINIVPMVDVIFCLCVFFMCSMKFKLIEGKFDSWLPLDKGLASGPPSLMDEIRVALLWDDKTETTRRQMGLRVVKTDDELQKLLQGARSDWVEAGKTDIPVTVDADPRVPWKEVVTVINLCKRERLDKIEFAFGAKE